MSEKVTLLPVTKKENTVESVPKETLTTTNTSVTTDVSPGESIQSLSVFQGAIYASFALAFCLAGFASVILYRKALKTKVLRFSMAAKILAAAFVGIALNSFFATYLFNNYLSGGDINTPTICSMLIWVLVGPAIAVILNALLTREDSPGKLKTFLDAFVYIVIFGCIIASMAPDLEKNTALVFSFLGAFFFVIPIVRFLTALRLAKIRHPEVREVFIQILIYVLLFLPLLLSALAIVSVYQIIDSELKLFLINFIIFNFVLIVGLLMVIAIDYVTQGINLEQPINVAAGSSGKTSTDSPQLSPDLDPVAASPAKHQEPRKPVEPNVEKTEEPKIEKTEPKVVKSEPTQHPANTGLSHPEPQKAKPDPKLPPVSNKPKKPSTAPVIPEIKKASNPEKIPKPLKLPKSSEGIKRVKAPDKPKKRF